MRRVMRLTTGSSFPPMPTRKAGKGKAGPGSVPVDRCQVCGSADLESVIFLGYLPPVTAMPPIGSPLSEQPAYPAQVLRCPRCDLVQSGIIVDRRVLFPPDYPYFSGTTRALRDNFADLYREVTSRYALEQADLVVDIGSNDGTLLANFRDGGFRVFGIEPTNTASVARERGIPTDIAFFDRAAASRVVKSHGKARVVTATNVFAHMEDPAGVVKNVLTMLHDDGLFISETGYWTALVETLQYDAVYHEHLRYYTLSSLKYLMESRGLQIVRAKRIAAHGGSIRMYACRAGVRPVDDSVERTLEQERRSLTAANLERFRNGVVQSKLALMALLKEVRAAGHKVYGVGAPSRASTLLNYVGLNESLLDCVLEIAGSTKIGRYFPGTVIPVLDEKKLFEDPPHYALLFSWHIADELIPKLKQRGYRGKFIVPLPEPRVIS
jgi:hypothetical protein